MIKALVVALTLAVSPGAFAQGQEKSPALDVSASFAEQNARIRSELADGKTFAEIAPRQRTDVTLALGRIESTLAGAETVAELTPRQRADLLNDQEVVNTILMQAGEESRLVCKREKKVGSHRPTTQCFTVAERRKLRELSQSELQRGQRTMNPLR